MSSPRVAFVLDSLKKLLNVQDTPRMLGRWSSSLDKQRWELYADFANSDNCCCSYSSKESYYRRSVTIPKIKDNK